MQNVRKKVGLENVRDIALGLPGVRASASGSAPSFKIGGRMFACQAIHRSAEPASLMVRVDGSHRDELLAREPDVYYTTPHYGGYSCLLVRLDRIDREALERLLHVSCLFVSSRSPARNSRNGKPNDARPKEGPSKPPRKERPKPPRKGRP